MMNFNDLIQKLSLTHQSLYVSVAKSVNIAMTIRNWLFGYYIVEYEQNGEDRAKYGSQLLKNLTKSVNLKGISETNLKVFRQFYLTYPGIGQALPDLFKTFPISQALPDKLKFGYMILEMKKARFGGRLLFFHLVTFILDEEAVLSTTQQR
jgi:hypothetical protein